MLKKLFGAPRELLLRSLDGIFEGDEWRPLLEFVSPTFFDVVPLRALLSQGRELVGNATDAPARARVEAEVGEALAARGLALRLSRGAKAGSSADAAATDTAARGQRVLELYFAQLYGAEACLLDLRQRSFVDGSDATLWSPGPYYLRWDPDFLDGVRTLYEGYYGADDAAFDAGLRTLGIADSKDLFQRHFGDDPGSVRFDRAHFVSTFHDVFVRCRDRGVSLHRNFLPLGVYLATLHDHLGALGGGPFDVRSAFERATG